MDPGCRVIVWATCVNSVSELVWKQGDLKKGHVLQVIFPTILGNAREDFSSKLAVEKVGPWRVQR